MTVSQCCEYHPHPHTLQHSSVNMLGYRMFQRVRMLSLVHGDKPISRRYIYIYITTYRYSRIHKHTQTHNAIHIDMLTFIWSERKAFSHLFRSIRNFRVYDSVRLEHGWLTDVYFVSYQNHTLTSFKILNTRSFYFQYKSNWMWIHRSNYKFNSS